MPADPAARTGFPVAVHALLLRGGLLLLSKRSGTGWGDGLFSVPAGHLEPGESAVEAVVRETAEEIGIEADPTSIGHVHTVHRRCADKTTRIDLFFSVDAWSGEPRNLEPDRCGGLSWASPFLLPEETVGYVRHALERIAALEAFSLYGWRDGEGPT